MKVSVTGFLLWVHILMFTTTLPSGHVCLTSVGVMAKELSMFLVIIFILVVAFCTFFSCIFRYYSQDYKNWSEGMSTLFRVLFGDFDFAEFNGTGMESWAPFLVCIYGFAMLFIMLNVFIAILSKGFDDRWDTKAERAAELTMKDAMFAWATRTTDAYRKEMKEQNKEDEMMRRVAKGEIELNEVRPDSVEATLIGMANEESDLDNDATSGIPVTIENAHMISFSGLLELLHETIAERGGTHVKPKAVFIGLPGKPKVLLADDKDCKEFKWHRGLMLIAIMTENLVQQVRAAKDVTL